MLKYKLYFSRPSIYILVLYTQEILKKFIYITSVKKVLIISNNLIPKIKAPKPRDL